MNKLIIAIAALLVISCKKSDSLAESVKLDRVYRVNNDVYAEYTIDGVICADNQQRGVCWSETHNPTINNSKLSDNACNGGAVVQLPQLNSNTTYYFRAYCLSKNKDGVVYSEETSFKTR